MSQAPAHSLQKKMAEAVRLHQAGDHRKAERIARRVLDDHPHNGELLEFAAMLCSLQGKHAETIDLSRKALGATPGSHHARYLLAGSLIALNRAAEALPLLQQASQMRPRDAETLTRLGIALVELYRLQEGEQAFRAAISHAPRLARAHHGLGVCLFRQQRFDEALASFDAAGGFGFPAPAEIHAWIGRTYASMDKVDEAAKSFAAALELRPDHAQTLHHLAEAHRLMGRIGEAIGSVEKSLEKDADNPAASLLLLHLRQQIGDWRDHETMLDKVRQTLPGACAVSGPFQLLSVIDDGALLRSSAVGFAETLTRHPPPLLPRRRPARRERIKVAYLSADFHAHPVSMLTAGLFESHDRDRFEVHAFSFGKDDGSEVRARVRRAFEHFHDVADVMSPRIAALVHEAEIDIAVDLMGHTQFNRCQIFMARPAPIQVGYLGYPGTAGGDWLDYMVVDPVLVPMQHAAHYVEKLVHLPECFQVNDDKRTPVHAPPPRAHQELPETGFVYSCLNDTSKITPGVFDVWMRILQAVPGSVLWLAQRRPEAIDNLRREAAARGVDGARLVFAQRVPSLDDHIARLACADLFLDTFPYSAHTTGSDALWAGVPLLTCAGQTYASRVPLSLLHTMQLPELVTQSFADYETRAIELATDKEAYAALRARVAEQRAQTPLFDTQRFCRHLEDAYQQMIEIWLEGEEPNHIRVAPRPR